MNNIENGFPEENGLINTLQNMIGNIISDTFNDNREDAESSTTTVEAETNFDYDECINSLEAEQKKIDQKMEQLMMRKMQISDWRKGIDYYRNKLAEANEEINTEKEKNRELRRLIEEKDKSNESLNATIKKLQESCNEVKNQKKELEMKLNEMKKISDGIAQKASTEAVLGFIRTYLTNSKRKTIDKRIFAKTSILEMLNANRTDPPEDLAELLDSLDDEQTDPKIINVSGNLTEIHDNMEVKY